MDIQSLISHIAQKLIEAECYNIPRSEGSNLLINEKCCILYKTGFESSCIMEVFDSSHFNEEDISAIMVNHPEKCGNIDLLNTESIQHIKVFIMEKLSNNLLMHIEKCYEIHPENNAVLVLSIDFKGILLNRGIVHPYENICNILAESFQTYTTPEAASEPNFEQLMEKRFSGPASEFKFDFIDAPVSNYASLVQIFVFLTISAAIFWSSAISVLLGGGKVNISFEMLLLFLIVFISLFDSFIIGEKIEGNFGTLKYIIIVISGCLPVLLLFSPFAAIISPSFTLCGSMIYVHLRIPGVIKRQKLCYYCFSANMLLALIFGLVSGSMYLFSSLTCILFGFLISGCLNFESEAVKPVLRKSFSIYTVGTSSACILLYFLKSIV